MPGFSLHYTIEDAPPIHICLLLGFQQFLTMMGGMLAMPYVIAEASCVGPDMVGRAEIMGTLMFVSGLTTMMQMFFGVRLPIIQGASFAYVAPMMAIQSLEGYKCPAVDDYATWRLFPGSAQHRTLWMSRLVEIQGAMMIAGVFEAIIGSLGLVSFIFRFIGPLTIAPTMALIALSLVDSAFSNYAAKFWPVALLTICLIALFTLYLHEISIPIPTISLHALFRERKFQVTRTQTRIFALFPIFLAISISWSVCAILTLSDVLPENGPGWNITGYSHRADARYSEFTAAPWFRIPYPGQWGPPRINVAVMLGMFAAVICSIVDSIGDYCACTRICNASPLPAHALNRGITVEGLGCILAGAFGSGPGVTSYSENVAAMRITNVGSRRVIFVTACLLLIFGCFTKIATFFVLIPDPIIGGVLIVMMSMIASVGFSNLQFVNLSSNRTFLIFGLAIFLGIGVPGWVKRNQGSINTGSAIADQVIIILLSTGTLVGGSVAFFLDNTVPKEKAKDGEEIASPMSVTPTPSSEKIYDLPFIGPYIKKVEWFRYIPISPTFEQDRLTLLCRGCCDNCFGFFRRLTTRRNNSNNNEKHNDDNGQTAAQVEPRNSLNSSDIPSVATVNEAFDHSSVSRTPSLMSIPISFHEASYVSTQPIAAAYAYRSGSSASSTRNVPVASHNEESWTDL